MTQVQSLKNPIRAGGIQDVIIPTNSFTPFRFFRSYTETDIEKYESAMMFLFYKPSTLVLLRSSHLLSIQAQGTPVSLSTSTWHLRGTSTLC